ncbi:putative protein decapping 5 [Cocos nucifera]|uniref:Protein decapping 5 n=1 Tax=Cocos nucifera TaxID=13894 RepID=A0A8K0N2T8_COCNU|nr:putative protein decapping 5 [Cocos nucifera]
MAAESSRSGPSADSYIGSLISLTSKSEIRYEGILYNINIEESSIGLRNVICLDFYKDSQQLQGLLAYFVATFHNIAFLDLQVKSPPPVQTAHIHSDPAIIQSHYSHPATTSTTTSLPSVGSGAVPDLSSHAAQLGHPRSTVPGSLPLYSPGGSLASWGSSPPLPNANGSGLAMPMYWQGYHAPSSGLPHLQQPPLLHPPPGLPIPPMQQQLRYSGINASLPSGSPSLPEFPPPLLPPASSALSLTSSMSPSTLAPAHASALVPETSVSLMPSKPPITSPPAETLGTNLPFVMPSSFESVPTLSQNMSSIIGNKLRTVPSPNVTLQTISQAVSSIIGLSGSSQVELSLPSVTPGQLLQPGLSIPSSSKPSQMSNKDVEVNPPEAQVKPLIPESTALSPAESKEPILPLPKSAEQENGESEMTFTHLFGNKYVNHEQSNKYVNAKAVFSDLSLNICLDKSSKAPLDMECVCLNESIGFTSQWDGGASCPSHHIPMEKWDLDGLELQNPSIWGEKKKEERKKGKKDEEKKKYPHPVTKFNEDFDLTAMNEKFKKDEVWGHLGKNKGQLKDREGEDEADDPLEDNDPECIKLEIKLLTNISFLKPVYHKDDFFDSLSSNSLDHDTRNGRPKFSEQLKIDTETFGDFPRHRPSRGGGRGHRGGRTRGSYYGRGYGYAGRGRGHTVSNRTS